MNRSCSENPTRVPSRDRSTSSSRARVAAAARAAIIVAAALLTGAWLRSSPTTVSPSVVAATREHILSQRMRRGIEAAASLLDAIATASRYRAIGTGGSGCEYGTARAGMEDVLALAERATER